MKADHAGHEVLPEPARLPEGGRWCLGDTGGHHLVRLKLVDLDRVAAPQGRLGGARCLGHPVDAGLTIAVM
jgi:hypothetical protein